MSLHPSIGFVEGPANEARPGSAVWAGVGGVRVLLILGPCVEVGDKY